MATIRCTCPNCGDCEIDHTEVSAVEYRSPTPSDKSPVEQEDGNWKGWSYEFTCPQCKNSILRLCKQRTFLLLIDRGTVKYSHEQLQPSSRAFGDKAALRANFGQLLKYAEKLARPDLANPPSEDSFIHAMDLELEFGFIEDEHLLQLFRFFENKNWKLASHLLGLFNGQEYGEWYVPQPGVPIERLPKFRVIDGKLHSQLGTFDFKAEIAAAGCQPKPVLRPQR